jgi:hypothetical protein
MIKVNSKKPKKEDREDISKKEFEILVSKKVDASFLAKVIKEAIDMTVKGEANGQLG